MGAQSDLYVWRVLGIHIFNRYSFGLNSRELFEHKRKCGFQNYFNE